MHFTIAQSFAAVSTGGAAWLMVRAGAAKGMLKIKAPERCAACGRRRAGRACRCLD